MASYSLCVYAICVWYFPRICIFTHHEFLSNYYFNSLNLFIVVPESNLCTVQQTLGATQSENTNSAGQKRSWTEDASSKPKVNGSPSQELLLKEASIGDTTSMRKRVKINPYPEADTDMAPVATKETHPSSPLIWIPLLLAT